MISVDSIRWARDAGAVGVAFSASDASHRNDGVTHSRDRSRSSCHIATALALRSSPVV
jgi:hypothetical protein